MRMRTAVVLFLLAVGLPGISPDATAKEAVFGAAPPAPAGYSLIYIYRLKVPPGLRTPKILVDGAPALKLPDNSYSWFYIAPGSHAIKTEWGFMAEVPELEAVAQVQPGQTHYLKMQGSVQSFGLGRTRVFTGIAEVPEAEAMADLAQIKRYSPAMIQTVESGPPAGRTSREEAFADAPAPPAGYALVYVYRPDCPPTLRRADILVDGREVLKIPNKGYSWFYVKEGNHTVETSWGSIYRGVPKLSIALPVQAGEVSFYRLGGTKVPQGSYDTHTSSLDRVTEGLAKKELAGIKNYAPAQMQQVE